MVYLWIAWFQSADPLADNGRSNRVMFLDPRDCQQAMSAAATTGLPENPIMVAIVSSNDGRFSSFPEAHQQLGSRSRGNAAELLANRD